MFEYQKFDIVEVAGRCGISLNSHTLGRTEVEAWCPFCTTKSSDYHLYLHKYKERFYCYKCSAKGNSVTLYARVFRISNKGRTSGCPAKPAACFPKYNLLYMIPR